MEHSVSQPRTTNADLALILGRIDTRLTVIEGTTTRLDISINGNNNGKKGLVEDHRCLEIRVDKHLEEYAKQIARVADEKKDAKEKREKFSVRTWAIVLSVISAFVAQTVGLVFLLIRTGAIK